METQTVTSNTVLINQVVTEAQTNNGKLPDNKHQYFILLKYADTMPDVWVTRSVAAYLLGVTKGTLEVWASSGDSDLPYQKCSRLARYRIGDIKEYIKRSTIRKTA